MKKAACIAIVAGRSGGHIVPGLTLANHYLAAHPETKILFFSTNTVLDQNIVAQGNVSKHITLSLDNIPANKLLYPYFFLMLATSFLRSLYTIMRYRPVKVVSMGGYISLPVCLAAKLIRRPVELYELNATPGKATRFLAPLATTVYVCFPECARHLPKARCLQAPYPIRFDEQITHVHREDGKKTLLILGGSQGSLFINTIVKDWLENCPEINSRVAIIHQTGAGDPTDWPMFYKKLGIPACVFAYHHAMQEYYQQANYALCRAGAGTLFELAHFNIPALIIPLETQVTDHQLDNAKAIIQQYPALFSFIRQQEAVKDPKELWNLLNTNLNDSNL